MNVSTSLTVNGNPVTITEFHLPFQDSPGGITTGGGNGAWFATTFHMNHVNPAGDLRTFQSADIGLYVAPSLGNTDPIVSAPDNSIWFIGAAGESSAAYCAGCSQVMRITPNGQFSIIPIPPPLRANFIYNIAIGPEKTIWVLYTESGSYQYRLAALNLNGSVKFEKVLVQGEPFGGSPQPQGMVTGSDGGMYISVALSQYESELQRYDANGALTRRIATGLFANNMVSGPDGALWLIPYGGLNRIERVPLAGSYTDFTLPLSSASLTAITAGGDGALWVADFGNTAIWRVTTGGQITLYRMARYGTGRVFVITARATHHFSPNHATLWFTQGNAVGKFEF